MSVGEKCVIYSDVGVFGLPAPLPTMMMEMALRMADVAVERRKVSGIKPMVRINGNPTVTLTTLEEVVDTLSRQGHPITPRAPNWQVHAVSLFTTEMMLPALNELFIAASGWSWWRRSAAPTVNAERRLASAFESLAELLRSRPKDSIAIVGDTVSVADCWTFVALSAVLHATWPVDRVSPSFLAWLAAAHQNSDVVGYVERMRKRVWESEGGALRLRPVPPMQSDGDEFRQGRTLALVGVALASVAFLIITNAGTILTLLSQIIDGTAEDDEEVPGEESLVDEIDSGE